MGEFKGDDLVSEIALEVLTRVSPHEVAIFPAASRAYFADKDAGLKNLRQKDELPGFGNALSVFLTPVVLLVLSEVVDRLTRIARKAVGDGIAHEFTAVPQSMFARFRGPKPDALSVLTKEQIGLIHVRVIATAIHLHMSGA